MRELHDLRAFERRNKELGPEARAAERAAYMGGRELCDLLAAGKLYPRSLAGGEELLRALQLPCERTGEKRRCRDRDVRVVELVALATDVCRASGVAATHESWSVLLRCSPRTAGTCIRELAACGVLERIPEYDEIRSACGKRLGHVRVCAAYRLGPIARRCLDDGAERFGLSTREICQVTEYHPASPSRRIRSEVSASPTVDAGFAGASVGPDVSKQPPTSSSEVSTRGSDTEGQSAPEGVGSVNAPLPPMNPYAVAARLSQSLDELVERRVNEIQKTVVARLSPTLGARRAREVLSTADESHGERWSRVSADLVLKFGSAADAASAMTLARSHVPTCECGVCEVLRRHGVSLAGMAP